MNRKVLTISLALATTSACQSLTKDCPENPSQQNTLLCAASGHYSGANQQRVESKKAESNLTNDEQVKITMSRDISLAELETTETRRNTLRNELANEKKKLAEVRGKLEQAKRDKSKSEQQLADLEKRALSAKERIQYLNSAPTEGTTDYQANLKLKQQLEDELDRLLEELAE